MKILGGYGIINAEGKMWHEQKKFLQKKFCEFGMTKCSSFSRKKLLSKISLEASTLIKRLAERCSAPTNISPFLAMSISNVICAFMTGVNFNNNETRFKRFMSLIEEEDGVYKREFELRSPPASGFVCVTERTHT